MSISSAHVNGPVVGIGTITTPSAKTALKGPPALPHRKGGPGNKHPIRTCCCCLYSVGLGPDRISRVLYGTNRRASIMKDWIQDEKPKRLQRIDKITQKPVIERCGRCLFDIGYGRKTIAKILHLRTAVVAHWFRDSINKNRKYRDTNPKHSQCGRCLYRLGFGYDRISRLLFGTSAKRLRIAKWISTRRPDRVTSGFQTWNKLRPRAKPILLGEGRIRPRRPTREFHSEKRRRLHYRQAVWLFFTKGLMSKLAKEILGCDRTFFLEHIRVQLSKGLTMENYGKKWHLDHISPIRFYDLADFQQVKQCFHYTNYQPLKAKDNMNKSDKRGFSAQLPMVFT
jgi:hypothetical protein